MTNIILRLLGLAPETFATITSELRGLVGKLEAHAGRHHDLVITKAEAINVLRDQIDNHLDEGKKAIQAAEKIGALIG